jgi:hypothetical protein
MYVSYLKERKKMCPWPPCSYFKSYKKVSYSKLHSSQDLFIIRNSRAVLSLMFPTEKFTRPPCC